MRENKQKMKSGFVAVEGVIVIMLLLLAAGGATFWYQHGRSQYEVGEATSQINLIASNVARAFNGNDYTGLNNSLAISMDLVTGDMVKGSSILNPWGGAVTVAAGADTSQFTIAYAGVPESACITLSQIDDDWAGVDVGGTAVTVGTMSTSATACGDDNTITWTKN